MSAVIITFILTVNAAFVFITAAFNSLSFLKNDNNNKKRLFPVIIRTFFILAHYFRY